MTKDSLQDISLNCDLLKFCIGIVNYRRYLVNPHVQTVQNMYGKGGQRVSKAELRPPEVGPYFERKKISLGGVTKNYQATILIVERNPPERKFLYMLKIFSQEDFALRSKLWPNNFS